MKVIFTGDPIELERAEGLSRLSTQMFGMNFPMSAEVDVSHLSDKQKLKLANHSHFRVAGIDAPAAPLVLPVSALRPAQAAEAVDDDDTDAEAAVDDAAEAAEVEALKERIANTPKKKKKAAA
jgi:hypothetical protein